MFWAFSAELEKKYLKIFDMFFKFQTKFIHEVDYLQFNNGETFCISNDRIILSSSHPLEKIAISYALAQVS